MDAKVLVACHKEVSVPKDELYLPIQVGAKGKESIGFQRDDEGIHISSENRYYSELTGLFWAWQNTKYEYLGLCHYRRYFALHNKASGTLDDVLTKAQLEPLLAQYKVILPKKRKYYVETLASHYAHTMNEDHLPIAREVIQRVAPEYLESFDQTLKQTSGYMFNMFIMPKELVDSYCAWLFPLLTELVKEIGTYENDFENRYAGRISERLFNVWLNEQLKSNRLKQEDLYELPYIYLGEVNYFKKVTSFIKARIFRKKYDQSF